MKLLVIAGVLLLTLSARAQQPVALDKIVPTAQQLGAGWSNRVVVLVDPLSSPSVVTNRNEGPGWLRAARNVVGKNGCESYAVTRGLSGSNSVLVVIRRFNSSKDIRPDWGTDKAIKDASNKLPKVGDEVRFYQRQGMHNNIAFRRGAYLIDVEGVGAPIERLAQMAQALDGNLLKMQRQPAPKG